MGSAADLYAELNKLKKEVLIEIIMNKSIPSGVNVSAELRKVIKSGEQEVSVDTSKDARESNLEEGVKVIQLESRVSVLKTELNCSQYIISTLEKTIQDKEDIISLLKNQPSNSKIISEKSSVAESKQNTVTAGVSSVGNKHGTPNNVQRALAGRKQSDIIVGEGQSTGASAKSTGFSGALRRAWLYVGRAHKNTTEQHVTQHLKMNFPNKDFTVEALPVSETANSVSFKVGADISLLDQLSQPEVWPKDVVVRRFKFFRSRAPPPSQ